MPERKWFEIPLTGADPIVPLQLPPAAARAHSGYVERRTGDFCGCCGRGACGNCCGLGSLCARFTRPKVTVDAFGRLVTRRRICGLDPLNVAGVCLYALIIACAILLFYAMALILNQIAAENAAESASGETGSGGVAVMLEVAGGLELASGLLYS